MDKPMKIYLKMYKDNMRDYWMMKEWHNELEDGSDRNYIESTMDKRFKMAEENIQRMKSRISEIEMKHRTSPDHNEHHIKGWRETWDCMIKYFEDEIYEIKNKMK